MLQLCGSVDLFPAIHTYNWGLSWAYRGLSYIAFTTIGKGPWLHTISIISFVLIANCGILHFIYFSSPENTWNWTCEPPQTLYCNLRASFLKNDVNLIVTWDFWDPKNIHNWQTSSSWRQDESRKYGHRNARWWVFPPPIFEKHRGASQNGSQKILPKFSGWRNQKSTPKDEHRTWKWWLPGCIWNYHLVCKHTSVYRRFPIGHPDLDTPQALWNSINAENEETTSPRKQRIYLEVRINDWDQWVISPTCTNGLHLGL